MQKQTKSSSLKIVRPKAQGTCGGVQSASSGAVDATAIPRVRLPWTTAAAVAVSVAWRAGAVAADRQNRFYGLALLIVSYPAYRTMRRAIAAEASLAIPASHNTSID
jgi:hypothetical protein